jgi:hypothetical protein
MLFLLTCKKKADPVAEEPETPAPTTPKTDYRDSIIGYYNVTYTVTFDGSNYIKTQLVNVRKATTGEIPFYWQNKTTLDSCITIDNVLIANNGPAIPYSWCTKLGPDLVGYREYNSKIDLRNKRFDYDSGCCGCGSKSCRTYGKGPKVPN